MRPHNRYFVAIACAFLISQPGAFGVSLTTTARTPFNSRNSSIPEPGQSVQEDVNAQTSLHVDRVPVRVAKSSDEQPVEVADEAKSKPEENSSRETRVEKKFRGSSIAGLRSSDTTEIAGKSKIAHDDAVRKLPVYGRREVRGEIQLKQRHRNPADFKDLAKEGPFTTLAGKDQSPQQAQESQHKRAHGEGGAVEMRTGKEAIRRYLQSRFKLGSIRRKYSGESKGIHRRDGDYGTNFDYMNNMCKGTDNQVARQMGFEAFLNALEEVIMEGMTYRETACRILSDRHGSLAELLREGPRERDTGKNERRESTPHDDVIYLFDIFNGRAPAKIQKARALLQNRVQTLKENVEMCFHLDSEFAHPFPTGERLREKLKDLQNRIRVARSEQNDPDFWPNNWVTQPPFDKDCNIPDLLKSEGRHTPREADAKEKSLRSALIKSLKSEFFQYHASLITALRNLVGELYAADLKEEKMKKFDEEVAQPRSDTMEKVHGYGFPLELPQISWFDQTKDHTSGFYATVYMKSAALSYGEGIAMLGPAAATTNLVGTAAVNYPVVSFELFHKPDQAKEEPNPQEDHEVHFRDYYWPSFEPVEDDANYEGLSPAADNVFASRFAKHHVCRNMAMYQGAEWEFEGTKKLPPDFYPLRLPPNCKLDSQHKEGQENAVQGIACAEEDKLIHDRREAEDETKELEWKKKNPYDFFREKVHRLMKHTRSAMSEVGFLLKDHVCLTAEEEYNEFMRDMHSDLKDALISVRVLKQDLEDIAHSLKQLLKVPKSSRSPVIWEEKNEGKHSRPFDESFAYLFDDPVGKVFVVTFSVTNDDEDEDEEMQTPYPIQTKWAVFEDYDSGLMEAIPTDQLGDFYAFDEFDKRPGDFAWEELNRPWDDMEAHRAAHFALQRINAKAKGQQQLLSVDSAFILEGYELTLTLDPRQHEPLDPETRYLHKLRLCEDWIDNVRLEMPDQRLDWQERQLVYEMVKTQLRQLSNVLRNRLVHPIEAFRDYQGFKTWIQSAKSEKPIENCHYCQEPWKRIGLCASGAEGPDPLWEESYLFYVRHVMVEMAHNLVETENFMLDVLRFMRDDDPRQAREEFRYTFPDMEDLSSQVPMMPGFYPICMPRNCFLDTERMDNGNMYLMSGASGSVNGIRCPLDEELVYKELEDHFAYEVGALDARTSSRFTSPIAGTGPPIYHSDHRKHLDHLNHWHHNPYHVYNDRQES